MCSGCSLHVAVGFCSLTCPRWACRLGPLLEIFTPGSPGPWATLCPNMNFTANDTAMWELDTLFSLEKFQTEKGVCMLTLDCLSCSGCTYMVLNHTRGLNDRKILKINKFDLPFGSYHLAPGTARTFLWASSTWTVDFFFFVLQLEVTCSRSHFSYHLNQTL